MLIKYVKNSNFKQINQIRINFKTFTLNNQSDNINSLKTDLYKLSLLNVEKFGWTEQSIKFAANELGYSHGLYALIKGECDLLIYCLENWNNRLKIDLEELRNDQNLNEDEKILKALKIRLSYQIPLVNNWAGAIKIGMDPRNASKILEKQLVMAEYICSLGEDTSMSKKLLILKIFLACELHLLTDRSFNLSSSWDFLNKAYSININIYNSLNKFTMVNSAFLTMIKYSLTSLIPYDFTKADEILKMQLELSELEKENKNLINT
jgi:rpsU-divergently transcribed protein